MAEEEEQEYQLSESQINGNSKLSYYLKYASSE